MYPGYFKNPLPPCIVSTCVMYPWVQAKTPKICKIPGVLWPAIYGRSLNAQFQLSFRFCSFDIFVNFLWEIARKTRFYLVSLKIQEYNQNIPVLAFRLQIMGTSKINYKIARRSLYKHNVDLSVSGELRINISICKSVLYAFSLIFCNCVNANMPSFNYILCSG